MRTRPFATVLVAAALVAALPAAASAAVRLKTGTAAVRLKTESAAVKLKTETAAGGPVSVRLTYKQGPQSFQVSGTHLQIVRAGVTLLDANVSRPCNQCAAVPAGAFGGRSLRVADLDGDGEPEVLLDLYTGGAHCCSYTWIYRYTGTGYSGKQAIWGDVGYTLKDLDGDGIPELNSFDDRFAYAFTDFADSWFPPQIWRYRAGVLTDITRSFPRIVSREARRALRTYHRVSRKRDERGLIAAYVADQYLLGHPARGWKVVRSAMRRGLLKGFGRFDSWPHGAAYSRALRKFLRRNGYSQPASG